MAAPLIPQCYKLPAGQETILPDASKNAVPAAYQPVEGTCNTNYYKIPQLFDDRQPCYYTPEQAAARGMDPLDTPTESDCLAILSCCWESREDVVQKYTHASRCYMKHEGAGAKTLAFSLTDLANQANGFNME